MKKVSDVIKLFETHTSTRVDKVLDKAVNLAKEVCIGKSYSEDDKIVCLKEILKCASAEEELEKVEKEKVKGNVEKELEVIIRSTNLIGIYSDVVGMWRDSLMHLKGPEYDTILSLLKKVISMKEVPPHDRIYTAVHFYNTCQYHICYPCFEELSMDKELPLVYRLEAVKFLFASDDDDYREASKKAIINIIGNHDYPCSERYASIKPYIPKTGIRTVMNMQKLKVPREDWFIRDLQIAFFADSSNDYTYRSLSGQFLLQLSDECFSPSEKSNVITSFFEIAYDNSRIESERATAFDIILRLGDDNQKIKAREGIAKLGSSGSKKMNKSIYDNSQNIHDETINQSILSYLEKIIEVPGDYYKFNFERVSNEIAKHLRESEVTKNTNENNRYNVINSIQRIALDTATFTKYNITPSEVLCHVWSRIYSGEFDATNIELLKSRVVEELIDMKDECSSSVGRLVNVFSGVSETDTIKISWASEIESNFQGRIDAKIKACNSDLQSTLVLGMMEDCDEKDRKIYVEFVNKIFDSIYKELYYEYVDANHLTKEEFAIIIENIKNNI